MKIGALLLVLVTALAVQGALGMEVVQVQALRSGEIVMDGAPATLAMLNAKLAKIKAASGNVHYYREQPDQEPTPEQWIVFMAIVDARVPIKLSTKPDFSDSVTPNVETSPARRPL
jgi:hypothetical protein